MQHFIMPQHHPVFKGHFQNNPIVPGVMLIAYAERALAEAGYRLSRLLQCKFLNPLRPEETCYIALSFPSETRARITLTRDNAPIMQALAELIPHRS
jgi:3-hydroxymyristoyl/3-hydroxydecanoyl-(acyl carrier protein) dehydratase